MTPLQKAQLKLSTSREAANDLAAKADRTPEEDQKLTELRNKHKELEKEYRTALEPTVEPRVTVRDGETREFDELLSRSTSPWQNLDFSGLCSFRTLALRWPNDGFQERKTANRAGTTPRNAPKGDSWLSSAPLGSK